MSVNKNWCRPSPMERGSNHSLTQLRGMMPTAIAKEGGGFHPLAEAGMKDVEQWDCSAGWQMG